MYNFPVVKEILLYGEIWDYSAAQLITRLDEAKSGPVSVRVNCAGGSPESGWGMAAKMRELTGRKLLKVDGRAFSMALFLLCYVDEAEALDVSQFLVHRAAYPSWIENNPDMMTAERVESLKIVNDFLRAGFEAKVDVKKFEKISGVTLDDLFSTDNRIDVKLTAAQAKEIGLINRIVTITPEKKAELKGYAEQIAAHGGPQVDFPFDITAVEQPQNNNEPSKNNNMATLTLAELKANHPDVYKAAMEEGVTAERDRAGAWLEFGDVDFEAVKKGIEDGTELSRKQTAELTRKAMSKDMVEAAKKENAPDVTTAAAEAAKPAEAKALEAFDAEVNTLLGRKQEPAKA